MPDATLSPVTIICPRCYARSKGHTGFIGRQGRCRCGNLFVITGACCSEKIFTSPEELTASVALFIQVYDEAVAVLERGGTFHDFDLALGAIPEARGWAEDNPFHALLVFQQNMSMAFELRARQQYIEAGAIGWIWREALGSCPICQPYVDKAFTLDSREPYPGFAHFGCDCYAVAALPGMERISDLIHIASIPNPAYEKSQQKPGALRATPVPMPSSRDISQQEVRDHWAEFARQVGWELLADSEEIQHLAN